MMEAQTEVAEQIAREAVEQGRIAEGRDTLDAMENQENERINDDRI